MAPDTAPNGDQDRITTTAAQTLPRDPCASCGGDGEVLIEFVFGMQMQDCADCLGSGTVDD